MATTAMMMVRIGFARRAAVDGVERMNGASRVARTARNSALVLTVKSGVAWRRYCSPIPAARQRAAREGIMELYVPVSPIFCPHAPTRFSLPRPDLDYPV